MSEVSAIGKVVLNGVRPTLGKALEGEDLTKATQLITDYLKKDWGTAFGGLENVAARWYKPGVAAGSHIAWPDKEFAKFTGRFTKVDAGLAPVMWSTVSGKVNMMTNEVDRNSLVFTHNVLRGGREVFGLSVLPKQTPIFGMTALPKKPVATPVFGMTALPTANPDGSKTFGTV